MDQKITKMVKKSEKRAILDPILLDQFYIMPCQNIAFDFANILVPKLENQVKNKVTVIF